MGQNPDITIFDTSNDNPDIWRTGRKIVPDITILLVHSLQTANSRYQQQRLIELQ